MSYLVSIVGSGVILLASTTISHAAASITVRAVNHGHDGSERGVVLVDEGRGAGQSTPGGTGPGSGMGATGGPGKGAPGGTGPGSGMGSTGTTPNTGTKGSGTGASGGSAPMGGGGGGGMGSGGGGGMGSGGGTGSGGAGGAGGGGR